jgi:hypothetical protein
MLEKEEKKSQLGENQMEDLLIVDNLDGKTISEYVSAFAHLFWLVDDTGSIYRKKSTEKLEELVSDYAIISTATMSVKEVIRLGFHLF